MKEEKEMAERCAQSLREPDVERELEEVLPDGLNPARLSAFPQKRFWNSSAPYYAGKDIMHDLWHIALALKAVERILSLGIWAVDRESLTLAACFHGFIYRNVLGKNRCYLPQTTALCAEMNQFAEDFYRELLDGIR